MRSIAFPSLKSINNSEQSEFDVLRLDQNPVLGTVDIPNLEYVGGGMSVQRTPNQWVALKQVAGRVRFHDVSSLQTNPFPVLEKIGSAKDPNSESLFSTSSVEFTLPKLKYSYGNLKFISYSGSRNVIPELEIVGGNLTLDLSVPGIGNSFVLELPKLTRVNGRLGAGQGFGFNSSSRVFKISHLKLPNLENVGTLDVMGENIETVIAPRLNKFGRDTPQSGLGDGMLLVGRSKNLKTLQLGNFAAPDALVPSRLTITGNELLNDCQWRSLMTTVTEKFPRSENGVPKYEVSGNSPEVCAQ